jgi:hypothetical protein
MCFLNGVLPAVTQDKIGDKEESISRSVDLRRQNGIRLRNNIYNKVLGEDISELSVTSDLEELSACKEAGKLDGKIAFIYLDGNRFGKIRDQKCKNLENYSDFHKKIRSELRNPALEKVLKFAMKTRSFLTDDNKLRIETLLWGGDEIEWIVPAWHALDVLEIFFNTTQENNNFRGVTLTHSAGVVFCSHNLPILQIRRYARDLCEIAKESVSENINEIGSTADCFAFLNIVSFDYMSGDIKVFLRDYHYPASEKDFIIKAEEIGALKAYLPILKKYFPSNKLHEILAALKAGNIQEIDNIQKRALSLMNELQQEKVKGAIQNLINDKHNRWYIVGDLIRYV